MSLGVKATELRPVENRGMRVPSLWGEEGTHEAKGTEQRGTLRRRPQQGGRVRDEPGKTRAVSKGVEMGGQKISRRRASGPKQGGVKATAPWTGLKQAQK